MDAFDGLDFLGISYVYGLQLLMNVPLVRVSSGGIWGVDCAGMTCRELCYARPSSN